jgi:hypothetical protein
MTPAQWKELQQKLNSPYGYAKLLVDGYTITLQVERTSAKSMKYEIALYVNGKIDFKQGKDDCEERRRFWRKTVRKVFSPAKKASILKGFGKRDAARLAKQMNLDKTFDFYLPWFPTFASLKTQLTQNNQDIQFHSENEQFFITTQTIEQVAP